MMKKILHDEQAGLTCKVQRPMPPWPLRLAVAATFMALGAFSPADVHALALGRITVLSALGEPLRAEIDIPQISAEEAASLKTGIPEPAAFRAAGIEYNAALAGAAITLQKRADGRSYLSLTSDKTVNEPFVDLILEANWSSGRLVRDYTLLFDPPTMRQPAPTAPVPAQLPATASPAPASTDSRAVAPRSAPPAPAAPPPAATARSPRAPAASPAPAAAKAPGQGPEARVKVQPGDTAGRIAAAHKPAEVSLDQMLVSLLQANPDAFIGGNVNRIKAGALLDIPTAEQAASVSPTEARKTLMVQSANFNEYRGKLADAAPTRQVAAADRQAAGSLQAQVEDKKPVAPSPDKLTLSKGAVKGTSPEAQIAASRQTKEATERVAELSKNISELSRLQDRSAATGAGAAASAAGGAPGPALAVGSAASAAKPATPPAAMASAPAPAVISPPATTTTAATPASAASAPAQAATVAPSAPVPSTATAVASAAPASKPKPKPVVAPKPEPSFLDEVLDNPLIPAVAGGLVALLAGFGFYRSRQRKKSTQVDSSYMESRSQPDSFFGSSGGQRVDTAEAAPTGSSLAYSPSQLDAAGDVDPVAEADVYLAYGRDLQAEEILKEALKMTPSRIAIHGKLLEIYAKRRDARAFEALAAEAHKLSAGEGPEWERICELGRGLDSGNMLYQHGVSSKTRAEPPAPPAASAGRAFASSTIPAPVQAEFSSASEMPVDLDLGGLDLDLESPSPSAGSGAAAPAPASASAARDSAPASAEMDMAELEPLIDITSPDLELDVEPAAPAPQAAKGDMLEFDLGALSLDLDLDASSPQPNAAASLPNLPGNEQDPMETKLALAQEFHAIGDTEGARALVEEVVARAGGPLKAKAERFLAELG